MRREIFGGFYKPFLKQTGAGEFTENSKTHSPEQGSETHDADARTFQELLRIPRAVELLDAGSPDPWLWILGLSLSIRGV